MKSIPPAIECWENIARKRDFAPLDQLLADDVVFESPIVHAPQVGRAITTRYLIGAVQVLGGPEARFVRRWFATESAVLELETEIDAGLRWRTCQRTSPKSRTFDLAMKVASRNIRYVRNLGEREFGAFKS